MKKLVHRGKASIVYIVVLTCFIFVFMYACSDSETITSPATVTGHAAIDPNMASDVPRSSNPVTISLWFPWGGGFQNEFYETVVRPFEEANPDIRVKLTFVENSDNSQVSDKLLTSIAGGQAPDVAMFDRFAVGEWAAMGALEDLSDQVNRDGMDSIYYPNVWEETQFNGRTYALPWNVDSRAMYYNKSLMEEAGLDPNKPPRTIAELDAMAEKMYKLNKQGFYDQVGFIPWQAQGFLYTHGWNFGGEWEKEGRLTPNDPHIVQALEWMQGYARKYGVKQLASFTDSMRETGRNPFVSGRIGFMYEGNWLLNDMDDARFDWGIAPMPTSDGNGNVTWSGGWSFVMPKGAKHQAQAWRFIKFVAGKEGSMLWTGRSGGTNDLASIPEVNEQLGQKKKEHLDVFLQLLEHAHIRPVSPIGEYMWQEMYKVQNLAVKLQGSPKALLEEMKKHIDTELQEENLDGQTKSEGSQISL
ncbi:ABC transporter substrate-binding protein [Paenibacillus sp. OV219]|uniref:ABC transporter substrate-binding protein n=1 Tax=Paenibacillus sp. OV219 TaxID=1884377 RepID=UPI0008BDF1FC|nr:ABC transporter substrate-binding protein [Paenibacillus sp. OV219]SEM60448.1 multiple sugar transport system substrate-binding protein [Paenibacillus sp. OV219]